MRAILLVLASVFIWMIIGAWLQALEGGLNQNFTTLPKACWALAENLLAKLQFCRGRSRQQRGKAQRS